MKKLILIRSIIDEIAKHALKKLDVSKRTMIVNITIPTVERNSVSQNVFESNADATNGRCFAVSVRLSKEESEKRLDLRKETVHKVCLKKTDMSHLISRVAVVLDVSGSMTKAFQSGMVQATLERLLPLAMAFDDDGSMEVWTFDHEFKRYPPITRTNFYDYIKDNKISARGGTMYAPVLRDIGSYFVQEEPSKIPTYVLFITDGDNADGSDTDKAIKILSHFPIFFQFVGIGDTSKNGFRYLKQ